MLTRVSGPQFLSFFFPSHSSTVTMVEPFLFVLVFLSQVLLVLFWVVFGVCGSLADLSGPLHRQPRGFLRGSPADLSEPPRRGSPGTFPEGRLPFGNPCWYQRGALMTATGGPLLGITRDFLSQVGLLGGSHCWLLPHLSSLKRNGSHCRSSGARGGQRGGKMLRRGALLGNRPLGQGRCHLASGHSP